MIERDGGKNYDGFLLTLHGPLFQTVNAFFAMSYLRQAILRADQRLWILGQTLFMGCEQHLLLFKHIRAIALGPTIKITEVNPLMTKMPLYQSGKKMVRSLLLCTPLFPHFRVIGYLAWQVM